MAYENEIPKELELGRMYTSKDLTFFVSFNDVTILCEDTSRFDESSPAMYAVHDILQTYIHKNENRNTYQIPNRKSKIYVVRKV